MNLFESMVVGHLVGDYLLQTRWMTDNKETRWTAVIIHSAVYTSCVSLLALTKAALPVWAILIIFLSHVFLDRRKFVYFWVSRINGSPDIAYLRVIVDQSFHLLVLAVVSYLAEVLQWIR